MSENTPNANDIYHKLGVIEGQLSGILLLQKDIQEQAVKIAMLETAAKALKQDDMDTQIQIAHNSERIASLERADSKRVGWFLGASAVMAFVSGVVGWFSQKFFSVT